ncbi:MAG: hypothetical protein U0326_33325 [Polyangiales bacterium]
MAGGGERVLHHLDASRGLVGRRTLDGLDEARLVGAWTARRPRLRRFVLDELIAHPWLFERALTHVVGAR